MVDGLEALHEHLAATTELPVERGASRWLGEAAALAADLSRADLPAAAQRDRLDQVAELLSNVGETGYGTSDEHVEAARELTRSLRTALAEDT